MCLYLFPQRMFLVLELCKGGELLALLKTKGHFTEEVQLVNRLYVCMSVCVNKLIKIHVLYTV